MKQTKKNSAEAQMMVKDLKQKPEIDQKIEYYKSLLKTYDLLKESIDKRISEYESEEMTPIKEYEKCKLGVEKVEIENNIFVKKTFFEMWLERGKEWDKKYEDLKKECEERFEKTFEEAKTISQNHTKLKQIIDNYSTRENVEERVKVEFYLLIKFEISKVKSKYSFSA